MKKARNNSKAMLKKQKKNLARKQKAILARKVEAQAKLAVVSSMKVDLTPKKFTEVKTNSVTLVSLDKNSSQAQLDEWVDMNSDYLSTYVSAMAAKPVFTKETARKRAIDEIPNWLNHPDSAPHFAYNDKGELVGYATIHWGTGAQYYTFQIGNRLVEDIFVKPEFRGQGYMNAIRKASGANCSLLDVTKAVKMYSYYKKLGAKSFDVRHGIQDPQIPKHMARIMLGNMVVYYDDNGHFEFNWANIDAAWQYFQKQFKKTLGVTLEHSKRLQLQQNSVLQF